MLTTPLTHFPCLTLFTLAVLNTLLTMHCVALSRTQTSCLLTPCICPCCTVIAMCSYLTAVQHWSTKPELKTCHAWGMMQPNRGSSYSQYAKYEILLLPRCCLPQYTASCPRCSCPVNSLLLTVSRCAHSRWVQLPVHTFENCLSRCAVFKVQCVHVLGATRGMSCASSCARHLL